MHVFEQMDKGSGKQYNARDLTWSYAELLSALDARNSALNNTNNVDDNIDWF